MLRERIEGDLACVCYLIIYIIHKIKFILFLIRRCRVAPFGFYCVFSFKFFLWFLFLIIFNHSNLFIYILFICQMTTPLGHGLNHPIFQLSPEGLQSFKEHFYKDHAYIVFDLPVTAIFSF